MADVSTITIEELTGSKRSLTLVGAGLPHKPTTWAGTQNVKTTWYPGNARASQQVLGPQETPATWSGKWTRTKLTRSPVLVKDGGSSTKVVRPDLVMDFVESIKDGGRLLRVTWATQVDGGDRTTVREGRLSSIKWDVDTPHDIGWEFMFAWVGKDGSNGQKVVSTRQDSTAQTTALTSSLTSLVTMLTALNVTANPTTGVPPSANVFNLGEVEGLAPLPLRLVSAFTLRAQALAANVTTVEAVIVTTGSQPVALSNMYVEFATATQLAAIIAYDQMNGIPFELMTANSDVASMLYAALVFGQCVDGMRGLSDTATDLAVQARQHISSNPGGPTPTKAAGSPFSGSIGTYECRPGDTPLTVSMAFYDSPDYVVGLLQANHLPWWTVCFKDGQILTIPAVPTKKVSV